MKKHYSWIAAALVLLCLLSACGGAKQENNAAGIDYMALVNKLHPLPEGWEDALETVHLTNSVGDDVEVEKKAYEAYERLKDDLEKNDGIFTELDSARRSVAEQQRIMDDFTEKYGADYAAKTVATPGYSEHHTGLALDLYFRLDGVDVYENEDMIQYPEIWEKIHAKLAKYGFILRYLEDREHITGYGYEPWHIRYIDDAEIAGKITEQGLTLEEYLGAVHAADVSIDRGTSAVFTEEELDEALVRIKCQFATWEYCELHNIRYAGDENNTAENIRWLSEASAAQDQEYIACAMFLMDFHSPSEEELNEIRPQAEGGSAYNPDMEYRDYQWWLGRTADGAWDIVTTGY